MYVGSRAVVASLWPVDDETAGLLALTLHMQLKDGACLRDAYRESVLTLRKNGKYKNPFDWAAFVLFGDGLQRFSAAGASAE